MVQISDKKAKGARMLFGIANKQRVATANLAALVQCAGGEAELQGGVAVECVWMSSDGDDVAQVGRPRPGAGLHTLIGYT